MKFTTTVRYVGGDTDAYITEQPPLLNVGVIIFTISETVSKIVPLYNVYQVITIREGEPNNEE